MKTKRDLTELLKKNRADSYATYLAKSNPADSGSAEIIKDAELDKIKSDTRYGALRESVARSGLFDGGYEEYLKSLGGGGEAGRALEAELASEGKRRGGYEAYLSDYERLQSKISDTVIEEFSDGNSFDVDAAFKYAVGKGLSEDSALYTAAAAVRAASIKTVDKVLAFSKKNGLSAKQAVNYARKLGLNGYYVDMVYQGLTTLTEEEKSFFSSLTPNEYLEYIKSLK